MFWVVEAELNYIFKHSFVCIIICLCVWKMRTEKEAHGWLLIITKVSMEQSSLNQHVLKFESIGEYLHLPQHV